MDLLGGCKSKWVAFPILIQDIVGYVMVADFFQIPRVMVEKLSEEKTQQGMLNEKSGVYIYIIYIYI